MTLDPAARTDPGTSLEGGARRWLVILRRLVWALGTLLVAGTVLAGAWQVQVHDGARSAVCGSVVDVVGGRVGWRQWLAGDLAEPGGAEPLLRTERCPDAENRQVAIVVGLAITAVAAVATGEVVYRRSRPDVASKRDRHAPADELGSMGRQVVVTGTVLAVVGVAAIALLVANPDATLFLYVSRPAVVLIGALALVPAVGLMVAGRAMAVLGRALGPSRSTDATD